MITNGPPTHDVIKALFDQMSFNFIATSIVDNGDLTYTLTTANTYHLQPNKKIEIDGVQYTINSLDWNVSITIQTVDGTDTVPIETVFPLYKPFFRYGRVSEVNGEMLAETTDADFKLPMGYLAPYEDQNFYRDARIRRRSKITLFLMGSADFSGKWRIEEHENNCIKPMENLANEFIYILKNNKKIDRFSIESSSFKRHMKFGKIQDETSKKKAYFGDNMSGIELNIEIPFLQFSSCEEFSLNQVCLPGRIVDQDGTLIQYLYSNEEYEVLVFNEIYDPTPFSVPENSITDNPFN